MELLSIGGLVLFAITLVVLARSRIAARKRKGLTSPQGHVQPSAPAAASQRITTMPGQLPAEHIADDGDDDGKYWRRYYS